MLFLRSIKCSRFSMCLSTEAEWVLASVNKIIRDFVTQTEPKWRVIMKKKSDFQL